MFYPVTVISASVGSLVAANSALLYILTLLYLLTTAYALRRLPLVPLGGLNGRVTSSPRLFIQFVAFSSAVRAVSIAVCTLLALDPMLHNSMTTAQWNLTVQLLFNAGDWQTVCCYALLMLVWLEMLQRTRAHVYDPHRITRDWRSVLFVVGAVVQLAQIGLYIAAFVTPTPTSTQVLAALYTTLAAFNIALPLLLCTGWAMSSFCLYAGFPFRSPASRAAWLRFRPLVLFWTVGRALWSVGTLTLTNNHILQALSGEALKWLFPLCVLTLFVLAELVPFLASLGSSVLGALRSTLILSRAAGRGGRRRRGGGGAGRGLAGAGAEDAQGLLAGEEWGEGLEEEEEEEEGEGGEESEEEVGSMGQQQSAHSARSINTGAAAVAGVAATAGAWPSSIPEGDEEGEA